ncbi:MAG: IclR family transcriptional regulator [Candidatus Accumulibacter sp.]|jgi:DNA-binding IclR family transcriptional regulator|nr:IclR family transcriptional regulator [Accumulibacter sp.]
MANISVSSVERGLVILELLVENSEGLPISAIARRLSLPLSATHRLLQALIGADYVKQETASDRYLLTLKLGAIGLRQLAGMTLNQAAQPILDDLARKTGELVRMAVVEGDEMTWMAEAQGATATIRYHPPISGCHVPLHTTGMGKAWLASMPEKEAVAKVVARGFEAEFRGPNAIRTVAELRREIRRTRAMGFAFNDQESELGLSAIAMLVKDRSRANRVVGAVSIAGPTFRLGREKLVSFAEPLHQAIGHLEQIWPIGAHAPAGRA